MDHQLTDNRAKYPNSTFTSMCESLGIVIETTAAESPRSNNLVERHNLILADVLDKVLEETQNWLLPGASMPKTPFPTSTVPLPTK